MVVTNADYQTMFIELTGSTADIIPTSLSQSFMGYKALDLTHGGPVVNTLPFAPGVIDVQPINPNPYVANKPQSAEEPIEEQIEQETGIWTSLKNLLGWQRDDMVDTNAVTATEVAPATGNPNEMTRNAEQTFNALAPGQEFHTYDMSPGKLMHHITPTSYDPSVQARLMNGTKIPVDYSGRTPCCKVPAESQQNYPFQITGLDVPFNMTPPGSYSPLGGDSPRESSAFSYDGRLGQQISPAENSTYTDGRDSKTLVEWQQHYTLLKISDDSLRAIPNSPDMNHQEKILNRR
jgi:hypothetical protein